jgi:uncharacterized membrane protein
LCRVPGLLLIFKDENSLNSIESQVHSMTTILVFSFLIGCIAGLRALTAPATVSWGAHLGWLSFVGTRLAFLGSVGAVGIFTVLAILKLINDKNPKTPSRTAPGGLIPRILLGACCGAALVVSSGGSGAVVGGIVGVVGALVGAFGGYHVRHALVTKANLPDFAVALVEDAVAIAGGLLIVAHA